MGRGGERERERGRERKRESMKTNESCFIFFSKLSLSLSLFLSRSLFLFRSLLVVVMESPCDYEEERARRIAENMKRLAELGVVEVSGRRRDEEREGGI